MISELLVGLSLTIGVFFIAASATGLVRLPDLYMRMSSSTKSTTLGVGFVLVASALFFWDDLAARTRILATIAFLLLTAPVAAHMIGRAAYFSGVPLWKGSIVDELAGHYDLEHHVVTSDDLAPPEPPTDTSP